MFCKHFFKRSTILFFLVASLVLLSLTGCADNKQNSESLQGEYFTATIAPATVPVPTGKEIVYTVNVSHAGQPVTGAKVEVALEMKEMDHGENLMKLTEKKPGVYEGTAILPMSGAWQAYIRIENEGKNETVLNTFDAVGEMIEQK
ncbi:FixH family protein [Brevibacillus sp. SYSU BS000544]|uniref:FixH family protein n=1 Tax=Brevibacillus sp. SYSU BS000544 TaxID=3416443 RepID=UPI003CE5B98C